MNTIDILPVAMPTEYAPGPPSGHWTYADYAALPDDGLRYELIEGVLFMAPAPGTAHQGASARLLTYLMTHVEFAGLGRVFAAPIDVELAPETVVQPDVLVILQANRDIIAPSRIIGVPDLIVEIASPSTAGYDRREKQDAYAAAGVREYWIVDPAAQTVELLLLAEGAYRSQGVFRGQAIIPSQVASLPVPVVQFFNV
ncbi:Uma2 family endonuclease [Candidatus Gracilibacteria bacterium]|nr:Uma2 family endonuclease [Candidatus Gracilibacteria bacterium]